MARVSGARVLDDGGGGVALIVSVAHTAHEKYGAIERIADRYACRSGAALPFFIERATIGTIETRTGYVSEYVYAATEAQARMLAATERAHSRMTDGK